MAKARAIADRRKTVGNIQKITRTMQLIATARFQQSMARAVSTKPYTEKISEVVQDVSSAGDAGDHLLMKKYPDLRRRALLLITSKRGLCGGYNANLLRTASTVLASNDKAGYETDLYIVGKKGVNYFTFLGREITQSFLDLPDTPTFADVGPIADAFMDQFERGRYASVSICYMKFLTTSRQQTEVAQLLPIERDSSDDADGAESGPTREVQYDFSPDPVELLKELLPVTVRIRLLQFFNDAVVSENVARMIAMKSASDSARDMVKSLSQQFNRARQTQITTELLDIMGGVEALK
jgi:F-type H+-transporting ATPase subunit gamma